MGFCCSGAIEADAGFVQAPALSQTAPVLTRSVWQCGGGYQELTERVELLELDFSRPLASLQGKALARYDLTICLWYRTKYNRIPCSCV